MSAFLRVKSENEIFNKHVENCFDNHNRTSIIYLTISETNHPLPFNIGQITVPGLIIMFGFFYIWSVYKDCKFFLNTKKLKSG
jgi:hypothetical protein